VNAAFLDIAVAKGGARTEPNGVANDVKREPVAGVESGRHSIAGTPVAKGLMRLSEIFDTCNCQALVTLFWRGSVYVSHSGPARLRRSSSSLES
jgi:hypothetical protein